MAAELPDGDGYLSLTWMAGPARGELIAHDGTTALVRVRVSAGALAVRDGRPAWDSSALEQRIATVIALTLNSLPADVGALAEAAHIRPEDQP